jgi:hypothetical protein
MKAYKTEPEKAKEMIFRAAERLAIQHEIDVHENKGLRNALVKEKQKRKRGRKLNLLGEDNSGPQLFSPGRVQAARAYQAEKQAVEEQKKEEAAQKRAQMKENKLQKENDKQERAVQRAIRKEEAKVAKAKKQEEIQARKEAQKASKDAQEQAKIERTIAKELKKVSSAQTTQENAPTSLVIPKGSGVVERTTRSGRVVKTPQKL